MRSDSKEKWKKLERVDEFDGEETGLLREILGAGEVSFFSSAIRLVSESANFVYEIGLLRVEPFSDRSV